MKVLLSMTVEGFYDNVVSRLQNDQEVFFCTDKKEGSIKVSDGSDWLCAERRLLGGSGGEWYTIIHACGGCSPAAIVVDKPSETDAEEIAASISSCCSSGSNITKFDTIYVETEAKDIVEEDDDMSFVDKGIFGDDKGHFILLEFHDGVAIGKGDNKGIVAVYPTLDRLTEEDVSDIRDYSGIKESDNTILTPRDVCLKFGRLIRLNS